MSVGLGFLFLHSVDGQYLKDCRRGGGSPSCELPLVNQYCVGPCCT